MGRKTGKEKTKQIQVETECKPIPLQLLSVSALTPESLQRKPLCVLFTSPGEQPQKESWCWFRRDGLQGMKRSKFLEMLGNFKSPGPIIRGECSSRRSPIVI